MTEDTIYFRLKAWQVFACTERARDYKKKKSPQKLKGELKVLPTALPGAGCMSLQPPRFQPFSFPGRWLLPFLLAVRLVGLLLGLQSSGSPVP